MTSWRGGEEGGGERQGGERDGDSRRNREDGKERGEEEGGGRPEVVSLSEVTYTPSVWRCSHLH